jgi:hypothetical protein
MRTVWKYPLRLEEKFTIEMPQGSVPLHVDIDGSGRPCVWATVEPDAPIEEYTYHLRGTGHPSPTPKPAYVGTVKDGSFFWHVYRDLK